MKQYATIEDRILHCKYYREGNLFDVSQIIQATNHNSAASVKALNKLIKQGLVEKKEFNDQVMYRKSGPHLFLRSVKLSNWVPDKGTLNQWMNLGYQGE